MSHSVLATGVSRAYIRKKAFELRKRFGLENEFYFPIMEFLEFVLPKLDDEFTLEIAEEYELGDAHGSSCPGEHKIKIRQDVYNNAVAGSGRDRFTVAHEIGHYLLHTANNISLARTDKDIPIYANPEWQADAFAGELLIPKHLINEMDAFDVSKKCGVSMAAARCQINKK